MHGQRKTADSVVLKLDMVLLWPDSRDAGHGQMSITSLRPDGNHAAGCQVGADATRQLDERVPDRVGTRVLRSRDHDQVDSGGEIGLAQAKCLAHESLEPVAGRGCTDFFSCH